VYFTTSYLRSRLAAPWQSSKQFTRAAARRSYPHARERPNIERPASGLFGREKDRFCLVRSQARDRKGGMSALVLLYVGPMESDVQVVGFRAS
jgi:hypothetical protein